MYRSLKTLSMHKVSNLKSDASTGMKSTFLFRLWRGQLPGLNGLVGDGHEALVQEGHHGVQHLKEPGCHAGPLSRSWCTSSVELLMAQTGFSVKIDFLIPVMQVTTQHYEMLAKNINFMHQLKKSLLPLCCKKESYLLR